MARTIESTTDTQEELDRALGKDAQTDEKPEEKSEEAPEQPEEKAEAEQPEEESEEAGESEEKDASQEKAGTKRKPNKGFQKRIDKLTREKYQLEARLAEYERQRHEQGAKVQATQRDSGASTSGKPRLDQFQSYDDYVEALTDWKFQQRQEQAQAEAIQRQQQEAAQRQQEEFKSRFDSYRERVEQAADRYEDWDEVTNKNVVVPESASIAIIESENGPDITYYLGKHPEVVDELHELSPAQQIARVAVIGYEIAHPNGSASKRVQTKAPAPVQPVGGSAKGTTMPPEPSYKDYRRKWLQEQAT